MMLMLVGCSSLNKPALQGLPELPGDLAVGCPSYAPRKGEDARLALAKSQKGYAQCSAQYEDLKGFYKSLQGAKK
jgi:hypothetical protein